MSDPVDPLAVGAAVVLALILVGELVAYAYAYYRGTEPPDDLDDLLEKDPALRQLREPPVPPP